MMRSLAPVLLIPALLAAPAQALQIQQYDKMAGADQDAYVLLLVQGAQRVLREAGKPADAQAVHKLFSTNDQNGISIGMNKFMITLALVRVSDAERVKKDAKAARLEVEHAMYIMLKKDGVVLPKNFMQVGDNFRPKLPGR